MENFIVSARKYRPATFDTVVGQESITNTLKNAIRTEHLAQAFLFCGPRGVGKTTCARILAKTINCFNRTESIEACNECESCKSFNEGASLNVYELDAASNNSVDDIRNLIDQVRFAPQIGSKKVYIIDEVHMLSTQAFNAFLKTLEEPPPHAIFILATTEKHKIIPTILSRCQIFDFNRIGIDDIANHLEYIAEKENISAEKDALHIIAQKADGALRDALSIFDQIVSFAGNTVTYQAVIENLNILDYDYYFKITTGLVKSDISSSLLLFNEILSNGFDGHHFIVGLAEHLRNILVCQDPATVKLLEVGESIRERYAAQAKECSLKFLLESLQIANQCDLQYKASKNQRLLVELSLMQIASINSVELASAEKKKPIINLPINGKTAVKQDKTEAAPTPIPAPSTPSKETAEFKKEKIESKEVEQEPQTNSAPIRRKLPEEFLKKSSGSISIKNFTSEPEEEQKASNDPIDPSHHGSENFTEEEFIKCWNDLAEHIKNSGAEGNTMVYAAMTIYPPQLKDDHKILVQVDNLSQLEEVKQKRTDLHEYLRRELKNGAVEIHVEVLKNKKQKKAYTQEEKFNKLAEKNPQLIALKKKLDLDFF